MALPDYQQLLTWDNSAVTSSLGFTPDECGGIQWTVSSRSITSLNNFQTIGGYRCENGDKDKICSRQEFASSIGVDLSNPSLVQATYYLQVRFAYGGDFCTDTDNGATDRNGSVCNQYVLSECADVGPYDDADFRATEMCCICGGGTGAPTAT